MTGKLADSAERRRSILLIDDHPLVREGLAKVIAQEVDLEVCGIAEEAGEAYRKIAAQGPDLIVVDLSLRSGSGLELIKQCQALPHPPRILVLSMHDEAFYAERAFRAGAHGYVMKRESASKVIEAIRQLLHGENYIGGALTESIAKKSAAGRRPAPALGTERLGDRELQVFRLVGQGLENRQIATELGVSLKTVQAHCEHIKEKLAVENATALIREAVRWVEHEGSGHPPVPAP